MPVSVAIGDNQASVLGSVSDLEHSVLVNVGTGSQISCVVTAPPEQGGMDCRPLVDGCYLLAGSSLCGGQAYAVLERSCEMRQQRSPVNQLSAPIRPWIG